MRPLGRGSCRWAAPAERNACSVHEQARGTQAGRHQRQHQTQHIPAGAWRVGVWGGRRGVEGGPTRRCSASAAAPCRSPAAPPGHRPCSSTAHFTVSFLLCSMAALSELTSLSICREVRGRGGAGGGGGGETHPHTYSEGGSEGHPHTPAACAGGGGRKAPRSHRTASQPSMTALAPTPRRRPRPRHARRGWAAPNPPKPPKQLRHAAKACSQGMQPAHLDLQLVRLVPQRLQLVPHATLLQVEVQPLAGGQLVDFVPGAARRGMAQQEGGVVSGARVAGGPAAATAPAQRTPRGWQAHRISLRIFSRLICSRSVSRVNVATCAAGNTGLLESIANICIGLVGASGVLGRAGSGAAGTAWQPPRCFPATVPTQHLQLLALGHFSLEAGMLCFLL